MRNYTPPQLTISQINDMWDNIFDYATKSMEVYRRLKLEKLLLNYKEGFCNVPAARKLHHNHRGGLLEHTHQVIDESLKLYNRLKETIRVEFSKRITIESVFICAVLHDLHKIKTYDISNTDKITTNKNFNMEHDIWTISEANKYGLNLTYDEMMGILQAHGGWSKIDSPTHPLACIIHCADLISSQLLIL